LGRRDVHRLRATLAIRQRQPAGLPRHRRRWHGHRRAADSVAVAEVPAIRVAGPVERDGGECAMTVDAVRHSTEGHGNSRTHRILYFVLAAIFVVLTAVAAIAYYQ